MRTEKSGLYSLETTQTGVIGCVPYPPVDFPPDESVAKEIRDTWRAARDSGSQMEAYRILERMVDRLGYGRQENNPSLVVAKPAK